MHHSQYPS